MTAGSQERSGCCKCARDGELHALVPLVLQSDVLLAGGDEYFRGSCRQGCV